MKHNMREQFFSSNERDSHRKSLVSSIFSDNFRHLTIFLSLYIIKIHRGVFLILSWNNVQCLYFYRYVLRYFNAIMLALCIINNRAEEGKNVNDI